MAIQQTGCSAARGGTLRSTPMIYKRQLHPSDHVRPLVVVDVQPSRTATPQAFQIRKLLDQNPWIPRRSKACMVQTNSIQSAYISAAQQDGNRSQALAGLESLHNFRCEAKIAYGTGAGGDTTTRDCTRIKGAIFGRKTLLRTSLKKHVMALAIIERARKRKASLESRTSGYGTPTQISSAPRRTEGRILSNACTSREVGQCHMRIKLTLLNLIFALCWGCLK